MHLCSLKRKFANTDVSVFPVLAKILKYIILNPLPACVGMVLVRVAVGICMVLYCIVLCIVYCICICLIKEGKSTDSLLKKKEKRKRKKPRSLRYIDTDFRWADSRGIRYNRFYVIAKYVISVVTCIHFEWSSAGPRRGLRNNRELRYIGLCYFDSWLYTDCAYPIGYEDWETRLQLSAFWKIFIGAIRPRIEYACALWSGGSTRGRLQRSRTPITEDTTSFFISCISKIMVHFETQRFSSN